MSGKKYDIVGIGMSMIDLLQVVDEFPSAEGVTEVSESQLMGGGPVPTALVTAAKLGASTAIIDRIGADWRGELVKREYDEVGVDTANLLLEEGKSTTFGSVLVRKKDGARHVVFTKGDFSPLETTELPLDIIRDAKILHLNARHWPACIEAAKAIRSEGGQVSFDGGANRYEDRFLELLPLVDINIVARDFAEKLCGSEDTAEQLAHLIMLGATVAAVTDGANGSWFADKDGEVFHQPAFLVESVVDTTGCGDVFHGAFLFAHTSGWGIQEAAAFASAAAAKNATALGGRGHLPSLGEIRELITG